MPTEMQWLATRKSIEHFSKVWSLIISRFTDKSPKRYQDVEILLQGISFTLDSFNVAIENLNKIPPFQRKEFYDKRTGSNVLSAKHDVEILRMGYRGKKLASDLTYLEAKAKVLLFEEPVEIIKPLIEILTKLNIELVSYPFFTSKVECKLEITLKQKDLLTSLKHTLKHVENLGQNYGF